MGNIKELALLLISQSLVQQYVGTRELVCNPNGVMFQQIPPNHSLLSAREWPSGPEKCTSLGCTEVVIAQQLLSRLSGTLPDNQLATAGDPEGPCPSVPSQPKHAGHELPTMQILT